MFLRISPPFDSVGKNEQKEGWSVPLHQCRFPIFSLFSFAVVYRISRGGRLRWTLGSINFGSRNPSPLQWRVKKVSSLPIFLVGLFVSGLTFTAAFLIGQQESADRALSLSEAMEKPRKSESSTSSKSLDSR
jgi:hypothetical protein